MLTVSLQVLSAQLKEALKKNKFVTAQNKKVLVESRRLKSENQDLSAQLTIFKAEASTLGVGSFADQIKNICDNSRSQVLAAEKRVLAAKNKSPMLRQIALPLISRRRKASLHIKNWCVYGERIFYLAEEVPKEVQ